MPLALSATNLGIESIDESLKYLAGGETPNNVISDHQAGTPSHVGYTLEIQSLMNIDKGAADRQVFDFQMHDYFWY